MQIPIDSIKVKLRVRKDMGDLSTLSASMGKYGQLSPIVVTRTHELVAGHRRLQAAEHLGWHSIAATYVDQTTEDAKLEMELQENVHRKDFSPEELLEGYRRLEKLQRPSLARSVARFFGRLFKRIFGRKRRDQEDGAAQTAVAPTPPDSGGSDDTNLHDYGV